VQARDFVARRHGRRWRHVRARARPRARRRPPVAAAARAPVAAARPPRAPAPPLTSPPRPPARSYGAFLDHLLEARVPREHVLVLNYAAALRGDGSALRAIAQHAGGPLLAAAPAVADATDRRAFAGKVTAIRCATRDALLDAYRPSLERLYARLDQGYDDWLAPWYEPRFERFACTVPCGEREVRMPGARSIASR
jgi:hypothetical protein